MSANPEIGSEVVADGIRTNVHVEGNGPPVLLIHGSGPGVSAWTNWRHTIPALAERFTVVAPDLVGFGYTERPTGVSYEMPTWRRHLVGLLDALGLDPVAIVGNSFGGALALSLATAAPERVHRLVLMGSVGVRFPVTPGLDAVWGYEPSLAEMRRLLDLFVYDNSLVSDDLARVRYEASMSAGVHEAYATMFPAPRQQAVDALATQEEQIRKIRQPTLIVHGREDKVIPPSTSLTLFHLIQAAQLHLFGECGHWVQIEHADRFNALVSAFLCEKHPVAVAQ